MTNEQLKEAVQKIQDAKPYLFAIEDEIRAIDYGEVTVRIEIRAGNVEKMQFIDEKRTWLKSKRVISEMYLTALVKSI